VHKHDRRPVTGLDNPHRDRRIRQAHPPALDLQTTGGKQPMLRLFERKRRVLM
jgi:hypothetical protein